MSLMNLNEMKLYENFLKKELVSVACIVDEEGYYPESIMRGLGELGAFQVSGLSEQDALSKRLELIELSAKYCVSTSFLIWCHTTAISFVLNSNNEYLKKKLLPLLEDGQVLAGTGLSNPMKYYAGMEPIRLKAKRVDKGYKISGVTPYVSNVGPGHWFGIIAQVNEKQRIFTMVDCDSLGLSMTEHKDFSGLNGTRSFTCRFNDVFIPNEFIISDSADQFIPMIRSSFVLTQVGMGLGLVQASVDTMLKAMNKQNGTNRYMDICPSQILDQVTALQQKAYLLSGSSKDEDFISAVQIRLQTAELALKATETAVLYQGAAGYFRKSDCMRRLREALFIAVVTPAIKHLKRLLHERNSVLS
ncbi:acyl-CoA dehydrogenase family protein [Aneurinibacillus terranovensis]|uniref:acyl-CoA dehydrogenase family protein n=1 Tax=Aneurinibacillus terranovensis TaxID=278991 RepID=UPI000402BD58|nr:acyl-CoA dehydrogenase family protein [Aneurinibacillus terranovensis]